MKDNRYAPREYVGRKHPYADRNGMINAHRHVAEKAVGHAINPKHPIHHINGNGRDNRPENLVICNSVRYHQLLHVRERALRECGNPEWRRCIRCLTYDSPGSMREMGTTGCYEHRRCANASRRESAKRAREMAAVK